MNIELILLLLVLALLVILGLVLSGKLAAAQRAQQELILTQERQLGERHQAMLRDLHAGLAQQSDRSQSALHETTERLRQALEALRLEQTQSLAQASNELKTGQQQFLQQTLTTFADQGSAVLAVASGQADATTATVTNLGYVNVQSHGKFQLDGPSFDYVYIGIATKKGNGLASALAKSINVLIANGKYKAILAKYGVQADAVKRALVNPNPVVTK